MTDRHSTSRAKARHRRLVASLLSLVALTSCGGSGGGGGSPSPTPTPAPSPAPSPAPAPSPSPSPAPSPGPAPAPAVSANYLVATVAPFTPLSVAFADGARSLTSADVVVVDGMTNDAPVVAEARSNAALGLPAFQESTNDAAGAIANLQVRALMYFKNGRLYRLDLKRGSGAPAAELTSALTTSQICGGDLPGATEARRQFVDTKDATQSGIIFRLPGPDGTCNSADDTFRMVRVGASATDAGLDIPEYLTQINDASGAAVAHLVRRGTQVQRVDASFANPVNLFTVGAATVVPIQRGTETFANGVFLYRDGIDIRAFNLSTPNVAPVTIATLITGLSTFAYYLPNDTYLRVTNAVSSTIIRISDALATVASINEADFVLQVGFTTNNIVWYDANQRLVRTVPKTGGAAQTLTACNRPTTAQPFVFALGDNVWCGPYISAPTTASEASLGVRVVGTDGVVRQSFTNSTMIGVGSTNPAPASGALQTMLLAQNLPATGGSFNQSSLRLYDGATGTLLADYGVLATSGTTIQSQTIQYPSVPKILAITNATPTTASTLTDLVTLRDNPPSLTKRTNNLP